MSRMCSVCCRTFYCTDTIRDQLAIIGDDLGYVIAGEWITTVSGSSRVHMARFRATVRMSEMVANATQDVSHSAVKGHMAYVRTIGAGVHVVVEAYPRHALIVEP